MRPTGFTILPILPILPFYRLLVSPFCYSRRFSALPVLTFSHLPMRPDRFYHFLPFYLFLQYRAPSRSRQPSQSTQPSHVGNTGHGTQTGISRKPIRGRFDSRNSLPRQSIQSKPPCRYSYPLRPNKSNLSRIRVRAMGAPALALTSDKPLPTSQENRSIQSIMRSHNCQSIQCFLPILPSQSSHTNRAGQYSQSIQQSQGQSVYPM